MSVERFRQNLEAGLARQRREQSRRSWSLAAGLIAAVMAVVLSGALVDIGLPGTVDQWLYLAWVLGAWFGTGSLLAFGLVSKPSPPVLRCIQAGLWAGALAVAVAATMMPLAPMLLLLPIGVAASIVGRLNGRAYAVFYVALPLLALLGSVVYQSYEASAI